MSDLSAVPPGPSCSDDAAQLEVHERALPDRPAFTGGPRWTDGHEFEAGGDACGVTWSIARLEAPPGKYELTMKEHCDRDLTGLLVLHEAVLCRIVARFPRDQLHGVSAGDLADIPAWQERMALASVAARDSGPSKESPNVKFVRIFNEARVGRELVGLFARQGLTLTLDAVEKVFSARARELPFAAAHPELRNSGRLAMTGAGQYVFRIAPQAR